MSERGPRTAQIGLETAETGDTVSRVSDVAASSSCGQCVCADE